MIVLQFDAAYFHWGLLMLKSLAMHEPRQEVLADTVNLSGEQEASLKQSHPRTRVTVETIPGNASLREAMVRRKTMVLQRALDTFPQEPWFAMFDADMLVRRPLADLWSLLDRNQAAVLMTNGVWEGRIYPHLFTPSGVVLMRRDGRELVDAWGEMGLPSRAALRAPAGRMVLGPMYPAARRRGVAGELRRDSIRSLLLQPFFGQGCHLVGPRRLEAAQL